MDNAITNISIVTDGHEIAFGMSLHHLFLFIDDSTMIRSGIAMNIEPVLYSSITFQRTKGLHHFPQILIGTAAGENHVDNMIFDQFGMKIWTNGTQICLNSNSTALQGSLYQEFINFANNAYNDYFSLESEYVSKVLDINPSWIRNDFHEPPLSGLFNKGKRNKEILQQQYDCLAYVFYTNYIELINTKNY